MEIEFRNTPGVVDAAVGYMGGTLDHPSYEDVCTDTTGHAEVVQLRFEPDQVSYDELLERFWELHDPTQRGRQGPDVGSQYRSVVFHHSEEQRQVAERSKERVQERFARPVATEIVPASTFWRAEEYHQQYLVKRGVASCRI